MANLYDYKSLMAGLWLDLDSPDIHHPRADLMLQKCGDVGQALHNELQNTSVGWDVTSVVVPVNNYDTRYLVQVVRLGAAVRLSAVNRTGWNEGGSFDIDIVDRQTVAAFRGGRYVPGSAWSFAGIEYSTATVAILEWENGSPYIEFFGSVDADAYEYRLWYDVGAIESPTLGANFLPQVQQFHPYARALIGAALIGYCQWSRLSVGDAEKDRIIMRDRRRELGENLLAQASFHKKSWDIFKLTNREGGSEQPRGYGDWLEGNW